MPFDPRCIFRRAEAELGREIEGHDHADGHGFAMEQVVAIAAFQLQRMAEGVAQIQQRPGAGLPLILGDDGGLGGAADAHGALPRGIVAVDDGRPMLLEPGEEGRHR